MIEIGRVRELTRYPVKSMAGIAAESAYLGWHGLAGDRRFAFRRLGDSSGFPWLTASRLPELILYQPVALGDDASETLCTHVRTPAGAELELRGEELRAEISDRFGSALEVMMIRDGIFDAGAVSVISTTTIADVGREAGMDADRRRMRANVVLETSDPKPFLEDEWVGGTLVFGDSEPAPAVSVMMRDERCVMVNIDPDTGEKDARMMKAVVRLNDNYAGVYCTVIRTGSIHVGQGVYLLR